ncbi:MAG TPA: hypothetical protein VFF78_04685 [Anaerolineaceae bacterium]|nr:hypothetical protein [Anaerolineaceae bacterium]
MSYLTKAAILAARDLETKPVAVPEWGGEVLVRGMTGLERDGLSQSLRRPDGKIDLGLFRTRVCAICMVDENGARLFTDSEVQELGAKSSTALQRVYDVASQLSALTPEEAEELEKNSGETQSEPSGLS